jgi:hypothetical protein
VTWGFKNFYNEFFQAGVDSPTSTTRQIITVERFSGCTGVPILKFKIPLKCVPRDDCHVDFQSQDTGATQSFAVKLCRGDLLRTSITQINEPICPVDKCGTSPPVIAESGGTFASSFTALIDVFLW